MKVLIVGGNRQYQTMFLNNGFEVVTKLADAELVQFCGGADVSPHLYEQEPHPKTHSNAAQDEQEQQIYLECIEMGLPMVGICRGGQFLNVMNFGAMYQHVDSHAIGSLHPMVDTRTGEVVNVTSTHHQMMVAGDDSITIAIANQSTFKEVVELEDGEPVVVRDTDKGKDVEVVFYPDTACLCFQPHPEFVDKEHECQVYYFALIEELICG